MVDRQDMERRRRDREREERIRRERRGPQGFTHEDWRQSRRPMRIIQNPLEEMDDYNMPYREDWEEESDWGWRSERDQWMDYGRDYDPRLEGRRQDWQSREGRQYGSPNRSQPDWDEYEMDYGRGVYNRRRGRHEHSKGGWDEGSRQRGRGEHPRSNRHEDRGYGDIRGPGYGWEGGYMDPYKRGFFRIDEAAHPDYLERYDHTQADDDWDTGEDFEGDISYSYTEFWLTPGPFTGLGPKGYQRSDERIFEDICYRMSVNGQLDPSEIDVKVENGEVTLEGQVEDRFSKRLAEDIADSVSGVADVHNRIRVGERFGTRESLHEQASAHNEETDEKK
jgi:hypothetical protein